MPFTAIPYVELGGEPHCSHVFHLVVISLLPPLYLEHSHNIKDIYIF